ncbi:MAG: VWA domain-containing protein, partial [Anaerolineae bacterium]
MEAYARVATWESTPGAIPPDALLEPTGLTADIFDGRVFVADTGNDRVQVFESDGTFVQSIGTAGAPDALLSQPMDVAVQGSLVFVADNGHDRIALFTVDGRYGGEWTGLAGPWGIAAGADGRVYVAENRAGRIAMYRANGDRLDTWDYGSTSLRGLDVAADGRLAIADAGARQVRVVDGLGNEVRASAVLTGAPSDVAFGTGGDIFVAMEGSSLLRLEDTLDLPQSGAWPLAGAAGVSAGPGGLVYSSFQDNNRPQHGVQRWSGSPLAKDLLWGQVPAPLGVLLGPRRLDAAALTLVADGWRRVQRFNAAGEAVDQIPTGDLNDVSQGPDGDILVATDDTVTRLDPSGSRQWEWGVPVATGEYAWIVALDYDSDTDRVSVLDVGRQRLWILDGAGNLVTNRSFRPGPGITAALWDIATTAEGYFVVNRRTDAIEVRGSDGRSVIRWWGVPGGPLRVTADSAGHAFVLDRHGWVWKYAADGTLLAVWRAGEAADEESRPYDLAVDDAGRILVADLGLDRVEVYAIDLGGTPGPVPSFDPNCSADGRKWADPTLLVLGEETTVTLAVDGSCPSLTTDADIVLVMDVSGSMAGPDAGGSGTKLDASKVAAEGFLDLLPFGTFRVAVVAFNHEAQLLSPLSDLLVLARGALRGMVAAGGTDIAAGVDTARLELSGPRRRLSARGVIVLLTDGFSDPVAAQRAADQAKLEGLRLFTVGFGTTTAEDLLRTMASTPEDFYLAPSAVELGEIYSAIADRITADFLFRTLTVVDEMPDNMAFVPGSGAPSPTVSGRTLTWQLADVPLSGTVLEYRLRPMETGTWPTNVMAVGEGTDGLGQPSRVDFPVP